MDGAAQLLHSVFGFPDFRPGQAEIVQSVLEGRNTLAIMPTGGGKSLCFQLPALCRDGVTVVISPLIALMRDQVRALRAAGVEAGALTSGNTEEETEEVFAAIDERRLKLLYMAPERLASLRFRNSLKAYLVSSLLYRDALNALYAFGGVYAKGVLGWSIGQIGIFGIVGAAAAVLASWIGGKLDRAFGPRPVIAVSIVVLILVCAVLVGMTRDQVWGIALDPASKASDDILFLCGALIGAAGGTVQAASRTMMVRHTTPERATEAFGLFALSGKVASFIAPALIAIVTGISGSQRIGFSPLILLFLLGLILLVWVNPKGEQPR